MALGRRIYDKYGRDGLLSLVRSSVNYATHRSKYAVVNNGVVRRVVPKGVRKAAFAGDGADAVHGYFADPGEGNAPSTYLDPSRNVRSEFLCDLLAEYATTDSVILEPGCNAGRNLAHLYRGGFENLIGIELNGDALRALREAYPDMAEAIDLYNSPLEAVLPGFEDDSVSTTYSMAVFMHIHPDSEFIFEEIARITSDYIITIEDESLASPTHFPRNYRAVFSEHGFEQVRAVDGERISAETDLSDTYVARVLRTPR